MIEKSETDRGDLVPMCRGQETREKLWSVLWTKRNKQKRQSASSRNYN